MSWLDLRVLRSATSYALSPAYYCSSVFWTTLGYSSSATTSAHDRLLTALSSSSRRTIVAAPTLESREEVGGGREGAGGGEVGEKDDRLERWEVERVERAVREAMREEEDEEVHAEPLPEEETVETFAVEKEEDTFSTPRPSSPPLSSPASPTHSFSPPSTPPLRQQPSSPPPATPLSAIHRLSRRSTLCLSTLYRLSSHHNLPSFPSTEEETIAALDAAATAAEEAELEEPGEKEREMVERVLGDEVERVRAEVERVVEEVLEAEELERNEGKEVHEEEEEGAEEEKVQPLPEVEERRAVIASEASWAEVASLDEQEKEQVDVEEKEVKTWFSSPAGQAFSSIPITSEGVETAAFIRAVESMVDMAELLAPAATSLCAADVRADISRVHSRLSSHPSSSHTLESLIRSECKEAATAGKGRGRKRPATQMPATESAVWLIRLLKFVSTAFRFNLDSLEKEELSVSFTRVWEDDFSRHVNWLVRPLFKVILGACPSRSLVYSRLAQGAPMDQLEGEMRTWVEGVERVVEGVEGFLRREKVRV